MITRRNGGGVIVPSEIETLHAQGIDKIFSPEDGRNLGLQGMINQVVQGCDFDLMTLDDPASDKPNANLARAITRVELGQVPTVQAPTSPVPVIGLTGTGGAGKSSLTDELVRRFLSDFPEQYN